MNVKHLADREGTHVGGAAVRRAAATVLGRPGLWLPAVSSAIRFAPRRWWRRPPFLPVPDERYWRFRMETAYGEEDAHVDPDELDAALRWAHRARAGHR